MSKATRIGLALAVVSVFFAGNAKAGTWYSELYTGNVAINFLGLHGQHTWSDSWGSSGCSGDMTQSWNSGVGSCIRYGGGWNQSSCSYAYNTVTGSPGSGSQTVNNCNDVNNQFAQYYRAYVPGAYAVNGVCHQATNRALWGTKIPWTSSLPIGGAGASYNAFGHCGTYYPYGLGLPNCKFHV